MASDPLWKRSLVVLLSAGHPVVDVTVETIRARHPLPRRVAAIVLGVDLTGRPPSRSRNRRPASARVPRLSSLVTAAAVSMVLVGVLAMVVPLLRTTRGVSSAQQWPAATTVYATTAPPSSTVPVTDVNAPGTELERQVVKDRSAVEALLGSWVPEVSAKKAGLVAGGTTFDEAAILAEYRQLAARYPQALLLKSGDYATFRLPGYWVTVVAIPFTNAEDANAWCDSMGIGPSDCLAARLTHTAGSQGNTVTRNR